MKEVENSGIKTTIEALVAIGKTKIPIPLAMRMVETRKQLVERYHTVEDVRSSIVEQCENGSGEPLEDGHPNWEEFVQRFSELMAQTFTVEGYTLYHRTGKGGQDEYAWTPEFTAGRMPNDIEPNVLAGLLNIVDIESVDAEQE